MNNYRLLAAVAAYCIIAIAAATPLFAQDSNPTEPASVKSIPLDTVLAQYEDEKLTIGEFFYHNRDGLKNLYQAPEDARDQELNKFLQRTFFQFKLQADAMKHGMAADPEFISRRKIMESNYLSGLYNYKQFTQTFDPNDNELRELYEEVKEEKYFTPLSFSFRHIFFRTIDLPEAEQEQSLENAKAALALVRGGSDFSTVAEEYSNSERKADIIKKKSRKDAPDQAINPVLEDALLAMEPGDVSDLVQTKYGYEILELVELSQAGHKPMAQVTTDLKAELRKRQFAEWSEALVEENWDKAVKNFKPEILFDDDAELEEVVAVVANTPITKRDFTYARPAGSSKQEGESDDDYQKRVTDAFKDGFMTQMLIASIARDAGYENIPAFQLLSRLFIVNNVQQVRFEQLAEEYVTDNPITEELKKAFYEKNQPLFRKKQKSHVLEMTFKLPKHNKDSKYEVYKADDAAKEKAQKAYDRLKAGEDFKTVAREMSESASAADGGDIGIIDSTTDLLPGTIVTRSARLGVNALPDGPQKYDQAYYLYTVLERLPAEFEPYDDESVQKQIDLRLKQQIQSDYHAKLLNEMANSDKIKLVYENFWDMQPNDLAPLDYSLPGE
ncbi:MAG: peptidylprolyl isomerase [Candidatus Hinthialibacter antarcticus]|nr:peptidylprolyl isomerase [Candidatus Hinthialibacter antarcticus]